MVLKKSSQALEHANFVVRENQGKIPRELMKEIESFVKRNALVEVASSLDGRKPIYHCCPSCLKAHLVKKTNSNKKIERLLSELLGYETGHHGYYMDGENLVKI